MTPTNLPESLLQRLRNHARKSALPMPSVLNSYLRERVLARMFASPWAGRFVLKGASLFVLWNLPHRPTQDLDLMCLEGLSDQDLLRVFEALCDLEVADGLVLHKDKLRLEPIMRHRPELGVRIWLQGHLWTAQVQIQIDVSRAAQPDEPTQVKYYPCILGDFEPSLLLAVPPEGVIADKIHAIAEHDLANTRIKDFYDLHFLIGFFDFMGENLRQHVLRSFGDSVFIPETLPGLSDTFGLDHGKQQLWANFVGRHRLAAPAKLHDVLIALRPFVLPLLSASKEKAPWRWSWDRARWAWVLDKAIDETD